jgi:hypothetical protein
VLVTIQWINDSFEEPCIFSWSIRNNAVGPQGFLLFRHTANGLRKIEIEDNIPAAPQMPYTFDRLSSPVWVLPLGGRTQFMEPLPERYRKELVVGSKYELVWPGGDIAVWNWGTIKQHFGQELGFKSPNIYLPGAQATLAFSEIKERQDSPPIATSDRVQVSVCIA